MCQSEHSNKRGQNSGVDGMESEDGVLIGSGLVCVCVCVCVCACVCMQYPLKIRGNVGQ